MTKFLQPWNLKQEARTWTDSSPLGVIVCVAAYLNTVQVEPCECQRLPFASQMPSS